MALSDTKLRNLKPSEKTYREADQGGLFVDVSPKGKKHGDFATGATASKNASG